MERDAPLTTRPTATGMCIVSKTISTCIIFYTRLCRIQTENASNETTINDSPRNFAPPAACSEKLNSPVIEICIIATGLWKLLLTVA